MGNKHESKTDFYCLVGHYKSEIFKMKSFISFVVLELFWLTSVSCSRFGLECLSVDCSIQQSSRCCSSHSRASAGPSSLSPTGGLAASSVTPSRPSGRTKCRHSRRYLRRITPPPQRPPSRSSSTSDLTTTTG